MQQTLTEEKKKKQHNATIFSNVINKIEDMSSKDEDYMETFLLKLEIYDFTSNRKKVVTSVVKH